MTATRIAQFYLDFVSPYSWLALMQAERFAAEHKVRWEVRPVVYAALLQANGLVGPAEVPAKRRYTFRDVVRCAHDLDLRLEGPPEHPFRSLEALRTAYLFRQEPQGLGLAVRLSDACWGEGRRLSDPDVLVEIVGDVGLDATRLAQRIADPAVKRGLRDLTEEAVSRGVFGVPTFVVDQELFWGHDRMESMARHLAGAGPPSSERTEKMLARPRGAVRKGAPSRSS
jgi:2-hydroxychromene-2-carboxylate isomerase